MNLNKPVAWVELEAWKSGKYPPDDCFAEHPFQNAIPLYISGFKELTDEEIEELIWNTTDMKDFARAILRKAQEK